MDPTIAVAAVTGLSSLAGLFVSHRPKPSWSPPVELTTSDLEWLAPQLELTGEQWHRVYST